MSRRSRSERFECLQPLPGVGGLQLVAQGHPGDMDQMVIVGRGLLAEGQQRADVRQRRIGAEHLGRGAPDERVDIVQGSDDQRVR